MLLHSERSLRSAAFAPRTLRRGEESLLSFSPRIVIPTLLQPLPNLSSRPERPDLFLRAAFWRVGPHFGASGRAARFVRPARFAGMEGSRHNHRVLPPSSFFEFRSSTLAPRSPLPDRRSLIATLLHSPFPLAQIALQYIVLRHIPRTQPASVTIPTGGSNTGYLIVQEDSHDSAAPPALSRFAHFSLFHRSLYCGLQERQSCSAASAPPPPPVPQSPRPRSAPIAPPSRRANPCV